MAVSDEDKERIRTATNILDLVGAVTTVRRSGRSHMAVCPFHQEKSASMSIDVGRGLYYCHGCHASGDIFTFVEQTQGLSFPEALEVLAARAGISLTEDPAAGRRRGERRRLVEAVRQAIDVYHRRLMKGADAGHARSYLRGRGYGADVVEEFRLGYAPDPEGSDVLVRELRAGGITDKTLLDAGLARRGRGGGLIDYFRDRLLFPIHDLRGDPVGFGGRILGEGQPKYLNSPDSAIYHKAMLLYGLDRAKTHITRAGYSVVVEGYTDVIALHRAGLAVAVATCGTALGDDHFDLLRRFTDRVVLAFDADTAGIEAALRSDTLETPVRLDLDLRVADMPAGVDPADLVQRGEAETLRAAVEKAKPFLQFWLERELDRFDLSEPEARARALRRVGPRVAKVGDEIARAEYARFVARRVGVELEMVERAMGVRSRPARSPSVRPVRTASAAVRVERDLLRALLADGGRAAALDVAVNRFSDEALAAAYARIRPRLAGSSPGEPVPLPVPADEVDRLLYELVTDPAPVDDPERLLRTLHRQQLDRRIRELRARLEQLPSDEQPGSPITEELVRLQAEKRSLGGE